MGRTRFERVMDWFFDPLPKEIKNASDKAQAVLYYEAQDEGYRRHKNRCYRNLVLEALLSGLLAMVLLAIFK